MTIAAEGYRTGRLCALLLPAVVYLAWTVHGSAITGVSRIDGTAGVLLGLYTCAHPAANAIDLIFKDRRATRRLVGQWDGIGWVLLNLLVMLIGWMAIVVGAAFFSNPPAA